MKEVDIIKYISDNYLSNKNYKVNIYHLYIILFYIDFIYYNKFNKTITDSLYYKLPMGIIPLSIDTRLKTISKINNDNISIEVNNFIENDNFIYTYKDNLYVNNLSGDQFIIKSINDKNNYSLTEDEIETINKVCNKLITGSNNIIQDIFINETILQHIPLYSIIDTNNYAKYINYIK